MKKGERFAYQLLLTGAKQDRDYEDNHGPDKRWQIYGRNHMAYEGEALRSLIPDSGLSITLTDHRSAEQKQFDDEHRLTLLAGDALRQQTWEATQQWLAEHGGSEQRFHLIVERGSGPLVKFPDDPTFEHRLLNRLWKMLSSDHGMMLLQLPNIQRCVYHNGLSKLINSVVLPRCLVLPKKL